MKPNEKMNASQKLEALEKTMAGFAERVDQQFKIVADELNRISEINVALAKRLNAIIKSGDEGGVTSEGVKEAIVNEEAKQLKAKVVMLVEQGLLRLNNEKVIDEDTFVVGREVDDSGKEINPRTQFLVRALHEEAKSQIVGKKAGDEIKEDKLKQTLIIMETYDVVQPEVKKDFEESVESVPSEAAGAEVIRTKSKKPKITK